MRKLLSSALLFAVSVAVPAFANVTVNSPGYGATVSSPFQLSAWASGCNNQAIVAIGFSVDDTPDTTVVYNTSVDTQVGSPQGTHMLHVKSWGNGGAVCVSDVLLHVTGGSSSPWAPPNAARLGDLQTRGNWKEEHDEAVGGGWSSGSMNIVGWPAISGHAMKFVSGFSHASAERYHLTFANDPQAKNFLYETYVYLDGSSGNVANLEMDLNQTMNNGQTVIYGVQCDGYTNSWDVTKNGGSPWRPIDQWVHTNQYCNPRTWGINSWHHVQISYSRDDYGAVTYHSVWLDGKELPLNVTVPSAFVLGWGKSLLTNFQVDGYGVGGYSTVYVDNLTISRW